MTGTSQANDSTQITHRSRADQKQISQADHGRRQVQRTACNDRHTAGKRQHTDHTQITSRSKAEYSMPSLADHRQWVACKSQADHGQIKGRGRAQGSV
ncbi:hypothetical protein DUNSADRAFT_10014 [Dunaliella salina]|uniref:Encoded protein n=1 Tax=Dunaliella salina TaxID=3046 RepID=A0ABQ7GG94_DUNSA|nr:hypothetical protein DUNSADRAFT_10014 [Dunaliella salina]|eukprot:KAF5833635.1 hypothetical protein DUNSADRAFT_10014 [Dunaliella salina]